MCLCFTAQDNGNSTQTAIVHTPSSFTFELTVFLLKRRFKKQTTEIFRVFTNEKERKESSPCASQKVILRSRDIPPLILYLFIRRKWVVSFTPRLLTPRERARSTYWAVSRVDPRTILDALNKRKISRLPEIKPQFIFRLACILVVVLTTLPLFLQVSEDLIIYWPLLSHESRKTYLHVSKPVGSTTRKTARYSTLTKRLLSHIILFKTVHFQYDVNQKNIALEAMPSCKINMKNINSWM